MFSTLFGVALLLTSMFLILLILVQRGRGGGLTGALGGMGGQSAFGAKAGDVFTRVTVVTTFLWIVLCVFGVLLLGTAEDKLSVNFGSEAPAGGTMSAPLETDGAPADGGAAPAEPSSAPAATPTAPASDTPPTPPVSGDEN